MKDIISSWAGLRPLIHEEGKSTSELSRKDEIFTSETGLISIAGGKLTGYRKMAERVVNRIGKELEEKHKTKIKGCTTDQIPLCGSDFKKFKQVKKYIDEVYERIEPDGFEKYDAWFLVTNYGKQTEQILDDYASFKNKEAPIRMIRAELKFGIEHEMVLNPMDFFIRRTGRLYFNIDSVRTYMNPIFEDLQKAFGYDDEKMANFKSIMEKELEDHSNFSIERGRT